MTTLDKLFIAVIMVLCAIAFFALGMAESTQSPRLPDTECAARLEQIVSLGDRAADQTEDAINIAKDYQRQRDSLQVLVDSLSGDNLP